MGTIRENDYKTRLQNKTDHVSYHQDFDLVSRFESAEPDTLQHADEKVFSNFIQFVVFKTVVLIYLVKIS